MEGDIYMIKKTISYTDYNGVERTEDCYFNLNKAEVLEMEVSEVGGLVSTIETIVAEEDNKKIVGLFKKIILKAYGKKSTDGKRFIKNDELREEFEQSEAFVELFVELATNADAAAAFINGVVPQDVGNKTNKPA